MLSNMYNYASERNWEDPIPAHVSFTLHSDELNEDRAVNVWLPTDYASTATSLPVLYMPDGGVNEDFPHLANTVADLIKKGEIPAMILVGIENIHRRKDLTGPTHVESDKKIAPVVGQSAKFREFIERELFPEIEKRYRTNGKRGIIGESLAGLFVVETFLLSPQMFDYFIAFDPSLWWNDHELVTQASDWLKKVPPMEKRLWLVASQTRDIFRYTRKFADILAAANMPQVLWLYTEEPKEKHDTIFRATKERALGWSFGKQ